VCDDVFDAGYPVCTPKCVGHKEDTTFLLKPGVPNAEGVTLDCDCQPPRKSKPKKKKPHFKPLDRTNPRHEHVQDEVREEPPHSDTDDDYPSEPEKCDLRREHGRQDYCRISTSGEITRTRLLDKVAHKLRKKHAKIFEPGTRFPEDDSILYDCKCQPQCKDPHADINAILIADDDFTFLEDSVYNLCLAVSKHVIDSSFYFQDNHGDPIPPFECKSTTGLPYGAVCNGWRKINRYSNTNSANGNGYPVYEHPCYDTWCVQAPWHELQPFYEAHMTDAWKDVYNGAVVVKSYFKNQVKHGNRYIPVTPKRESRTFFWSVSLSIHISAHLTDVRVYDKARVLQYTTAEEVMVTGFAWGSDQKNVEVHATIDFTTHVQQPLELKLEGFKIHGFPSGVNTVTPIDSIGCEIQKPSDHDPNEKPKICKQKWRIFLQPDYNICQIEVRLELKFSYFCTESFEKVYGYKCPYHRDILYGKNEIMTVLDFESEYWCKSFNTAIPPPKAKMDAFSCKTCYDPHAKHKSCATWDFTIHEKPHFEIKVHPTDYLAIKRTKMNELKVTTTCSAELSTSEDQITDMWLVTKGEITPVGHAIGLYIDDFPQQNLCLGGEPETTTQFWFEFKKAYFKPPKKSKCKFDVWAELELEYSKPSKKKKELLSAQLLGFQDRTEVTTYGSSSPTKGVIEHSGWFSDEFSDDRPEL